MIAQNFAPHAGMAPGHPGMPHGHPMAGMQHPGAGHMGGQPGPGMMQGMHPGVSGPQVTQGPLVTGMPPGAGTPAPGPMHNGTMAMAHLGPQQMFQQQHPQMNFGQMPMTPQQQQQMIARQRMMQQMQAQQQQGIPMGMPNGAPFNQAQLAQMKMGMGMHPQMQMNPNNAAQVQNFQQQQHQQRLMQQHAQAQHAAQIAAQSQRAAAHQMQMSRSQEQQNQTPVSQPTPVPQTQAPQQPVPTSQPVPQPPHPKPQQPQAQAGGNQQQNQAANQPAKATEPEEEPTVKQQHDVPSTMLMPDIHKQDVMMGGQCILQLIMYQDTLAAPERPNDLDYWDGIIARYFSQFGSIRQQLFSNKNGVDKTFMLQYPCLARYYHTHFASGVKKVLLQSYDHNQSKLPNGGVQIFSGNASLTYVFNNDIRVTTTGQLRVIFDEMAKIEHLNISTSGWQEYIPRNALLQPPSPETKQSPKINKNVKRAQGKAGGANSVPTIPSSGVGEWGVPNHIFQFLEIAEVMTAMGPLMEYFHTHPGIGIKDTLFRVTQENAQAMAQANNVRMQNQIARAANAQVSYANAMNPGMNGPTMMNSPGMGHLGVPQAQGSPLMGGGGGPVHTPSPAQNQNPSAGGVAMMHQMSAQGSNLSGSQGPSTNTSPNVSNKRRRASAVKLEEENPGGDSGGANKVKPSPKIGGKRQKGAAGVAS
ncbi:Transcriptional activator ptaB [Exophiala dermatitidis]